MSEHEREVYCRTCHTRLFGPGATRSSVAADTAVNARAAPAYLDSNSEARDLTSATVPPALPQRAAPQNDATDSAIPPAAPAEYTSPQKPPRARAYSSASQHGPVLGSSPQTASPKPVGNVRPVAKRPPEISPSSIFSSGRAKFSIPANKDICPRCSKPIYHAEKVVGPKGPWHRTCFKCKKCNTALSSTIVTEHDGEAFCKNCYTKLFSPRGYNIGGSTEPVPLPPQSSPPFVRSRGSLSAESVDRTLYTPQSPTRACEIETPTSTAAAAAAAAAAISSSYPKSSALSSNGAASPFSSTAAVAAANIATSHQAHSPARPTTPLTGNVVSRPASARSGLSYGRVYQPKVFGSTVPADVCPRCGDRIYAAEQGMAAGRKYHKKCIKCKACNTTINSLQITERDGEIYCKQCYAKSFGPKGYRPSLGTSINEY
ncbi:hypothetical protein GGI12_000337 [Dipsacomyces acuminosporus]|nr:hypothetical protein GGI12_000337 [Dipsacomyces acuminosporus]